MATATTDSITLIDGHYLIPGRAAAYLVKDGDEAAFVDNVTRFSAPYLLEALERNGLAPGQVRYIIVTHIHLDHSGGTAELAKQCPNATVVCHPRAERHIIDPEKLVAGAIAVYGEEEFRKLYGEIEPVAAERVQSLEDEATLPLGNRTLRFLHTPGHAKHHFVVEDSATNSMFTGDAFGLCYPQLQGGARAYLNYVCAPPQFDPQPAKESVRRIMETGVDRVYVTHFGPTTAVQEGGEQLLDVLDVFDAIADDAAATELEGQALYDYCAGRALDVTKAELVKCGLDPGDDTTMRWALSEHVVTSQGLQVLAEKRRASSGGA